MLLQAAARRWGYALVGPRGFEWSGRSSRRSSYRHFLRSASTEHAGDVHARQSKPLWEEELESRQREATRVRVSSKTAIDAWSRVSAESSTKSVKQLRLGGEQFAKLQSMKVSSLGGVRPPERRAMGAAMQHNQNILNEVERGHDGWAAYRAMRRSRTSPNLFTWRTLLRGCRGDLVKAKVVFSEMKSCGMEMNAGIFRSYLSCCGTDLPSVRRIYEELSEMDFSPTTALMNEFIACGNDKAFSAEVIHDMQDLGIQRDVGTYNALLSLYRDDREFSSVLRQRMRRDNIEPDESTWMALIRSSDGSLERAGEVLREIEGRGEEVTSDIFMAYLRECGRDIDSVRAVYQQMKERKLCPTTSMMNTFIARGKEKQFGLEVFDEMASMNISRSVGTYNALLKLHPRDSVNALLYYQSMIREGITPNAGTFAVLFGTCRVDRSVHPFMFEEMSKYDIKSNSMLYDAILSTGALDLDEEAVTALLNEMETRGITPSVYMFTMLLNGCRGEYERASNLLRHMCKVGVFPNLVTYNSLLSMFGDDHERAMEWYEEMKAKGFVPDQYTFTSILKHKPPHDVVLMLWRDLEEYGVEPSVEIFNWRLVGERDSWSDALRTFQQMCDRAILPDRKTFGLLRAASQDNDEAFKEVMKVVQGSTTPMDAELYSSVLEVAHHLNIRDVLEDLNDLGITPTAAVFRAVASHAHSAGQLREVMREMRNHGMEVDVAFVEAVLRSPVVPETLVIFALRDAPELFDVKLQCAQYNMILEKCLSKERHHIFRLCLGRMLDDNIQPDSTTFYHILATCGGIRDAHEQVFKAMRMLGIEPEARHYERVITILGSRDCEQALGVYEEMVRYGVEKTAHTDICLTELMPTESTAVGASTWSEEQWVIEIALCGHDLDEAVLRFQSMLTCGAKPTVSVFNAMIAVCSWRTQKAAKWYLGMRAMGVSPNAETFKLLLSTCPNDPVMAARYMSDMAHYGLSSVLHEGV